MKTPTTFRNHPLHPIFVEFPIALWIFALAADFAFYFGAGDIWKDIAFYSMGAGIVGAIVAAVPGAIDLLWLSNPEHKRIGLIHAVINVLVLALFIVNFIWRLSEPVTMGGPIALSTIAVIMLLAGGWLGAELVHRHGVTVDESAFGQRTVEP